ncbi:MAG TPA: ATP-binding protein [Candidatus Moranbacteria bacterium]|nr:ATP-binding protein [Candidatus Moranbacteria bacterium]
MPRIQVSSRGIKAALKKFTPLQSIAEYAWNGFDAGATKIDIAFELNALGRVESLSVRDNGSGIDHALLKEKFEPLFESRKALAAAALRRHRSALHGRNGIGRLTFFTFAAGACWETVYAGKASNRTYEIFANSENINFYSGIDASPKATEKTTGTLVRFSGVHAFGGENFEVILRSFLAKEFGWFLELGRARGFSLTVNNQPLSWEELVHRRYRESFTHSRSGVTFTLDAVLWKEKFPNEASHYYYLGADGAERWKERSAARSSWQMLPHSVFIRSAYFDDFIFSSDEQTQEPLLGKTRSDSAWRSMRRAVFSLLRSIADPYSQIQIDEAIFACTEKGYVFQNEDFVRSMLSSMERAEKPLPKSLGTPQRAAFALLLDSLSQAPRLSEAAKGLGDLLGFPQSENDQQ